MVSDIDMEGRVVANPVKLVRDVAQHDSSANIGTVKDTIAADAIVSISRVATTSVWVQLRQVKVLNKTTLVINAGLATVRGVGSTRSNPVGGFEG